MSGFQSPNYTQTPNDLFDTLLPEMGLAELKVVMCIVRHTFGYHKEKVSLSLRAIARFTGLTANSVMEGATQAEAHGLIVRHQDGNKTTVWEAVVSVVPTTTRRISKYDTTVSPAAPQLGIKESKENKKKELASTSIENAIWADEPVTEEMAEAQALRDAAPKMFEKALGFTKPLPWWSGKEWDSFADWVVEQYTKDRFSFGEYNIWRNTPYTKGGIANNRIRGFPAEFYDSWDMFQMSKQPAQVQEYTRLL